MILLSGSNGKLGTELKKHLDTIRFEGDLTANHFAVQDCDMVIHAAAYTNTFKAEVDAWNCFKLNVGGTYLLTEVYRDKPFVYISTEYAHNPKGIYALSKLAGEKIVEQHPHHLIIRTLFKPFPWPFEYAYENQWTRGDYLPVIAKLIAEKIKRWNGDSESCHIGTERKTMFDLARQTKPDVKPNRVVDKHVPLDYL